MTIEGTQITKKEFAIFKAECQKWVNVFGLRDWKMYYHFEEIDNALGGINRDYEGKTARVSLHPFQCRVPRSEVIESVKRTALHEILHLLLGELDWLRSSRVLTEQVWNAAEHGVIRRLEAALLERHG